MEAAKDAGSSAARAAAAALVNQHKPGHGLGYFWARHFELLLAGFSKPTLFC